MTEAKRMSEEQRQEYLRVMRAVGMPEEILHAKANAFERGYRRGMHDERGRALGCLRALLADYSARDPELTQKLAHLIATIEAAP
jgi:hypothetical protein